MVQKNWAVIRRAGVVTTALVMSVALVALAVEVGGPAWLVASRVAMAICSVLVIVAVTVVDLEMRKRQKKVQAELEEQVAGQTRALKEAVQQLEGLNSEQTAQAEELEHYADQLQVRQDELERALADAEIQTSLYAHASKRFESLFNGLPVGCATFNTEGEVMEWNTTMSTIARCAAHEALLRPVLHVFRGVDEALMAQALDNALTQGNATTFEAEWVREGVEQTFVNVKVFPMRQKSGEIVGGIMCLHDTTTATLSSREVAMSEAKFRAFMQHAPAAVAIFDRDIRYLVASKRWMTDYNLEGQEIVGRSHYDVFPEIAEPWREIHQRCLHGECVTSDEERFDRLDGSHIWIKWEVRPWFEPSGEIGGIAMMTEDVTDRRAAMDEVVEAHEQVTSILESINDGFLSVDADGVVVYINQTACLFLGVGKATSEGKRLSEICPRELLLPINALCKQATQANDKQSLEFEFNGSWLEFRVYPSGKGSSVFFKDITDRMKMQMHVDALLLKMNDVNLQLEAANCHLSSLATTDGLTGIHNHRYFQDFLAEHLAKGHAGGPSVSVILMDVDKFKSFNDDFGHQAGDAVLVGVAACLTRVVSSPHLVARYGGEEFVVVAIGLDDAEAFQLAEIMRMEIEGGDWPQRPVTASFGVAVCNDCGAKPQELVERADRAMYRSKVEGRNRTTAYTELPEAA